MVVRSERVGTIKAEEVQRLLTTFENKPVYLHVETTNGAYANHFDRRVFNAGTFYEIYKSHMNMRN